MSRLLRIAIDCRVQDLQQGTGSTLLSLAKALSDSNPEGQEYTFIVHEAALAVLAPYVYGPCRLVGIPGSGLSRIRTVVRRFAPLRKLWGRLRGSEFPVPTSDGYVEGNGFDLVHFPTQAAYLTAVPSIYQPWDLQHVHYPEYFPELEVRRRDALYRAFCAQAQYVCVQTEWTRSDVLNHFDVSGDKVTVIRWGSIFDAYAPPSERATEEAKSRFGINGPYFFYPAATWPHKNHEVVLLALQLLKSTYGTRAEIYFSGAPKQNQRFLEETARNLGIAEQVHFVGFVSPTELQVLYSLASAMVFPSRFEGFGLPILEAFHAQTPVIASNATTLPEVAEDAALYFDPDSPQQLATAMQSILDKPQIASDLILHGNQVLSNNNMQGTARKFQELYAAVAANSSMSPGSTHS